LAFATVCLIAVGLFPISTGTPHGVASVLFFTSATGAALLLLRPIFEWVGMKELPFIATVVTLIVSLVCLILTPLPFAEAVAVSGLLV